MLHFLALGGTLAGLAVLAPSMRPLDPVLAVGLDEILQPTSDSAVLAQLLVIIALALPAMWFARRNRDVLIFVIGVAVFVAALMAFRVLH